MFEKDLWYVMKKLTAAIKFGIFICLNLSCGMALQ